MMQIFYPRLYIKQLSNSKVDFKLLGVILIILFFTFLLNAVVFNDALRLMFIRMEGLSSNERAALINNFVSDLIFAFVSYLFVYVAIVTIINLLTRAAAVFFKRNISPSSLLNISIYSIFVGRLFNFLFLLILLICSPVIKNLTRGEAYFFIFLPVALINLYSFAVYFYGAFVTAKTVTTRKMVAK